MGDTANQPDGGRPEEGHVGTDPLHRELSRKSFLVGSGGVALGLTAVAAAGAANNPTAVSPIHVGSVPGPPDPAQIDSWLQVNPDSTVTLFHGWTEMGQGSPTAIRQIAAEELGLSFDQVRAAQLDTCRSRPSPPRVPPRGPRWARRACAVPPRQRGPCS